MGQLHATSEFTLPSKNTFVLCHEHTRLLECDISLETPSVWVVDKKNMDFNPFALLLLFTLF